MPVPKGGLVPTREALPHSPPVPAIRKAQVPVGRPVKAGGTRRVDSRRALRIEAEALLR